MSLESASWPWPDELDGVTAAPVSHRVLIDEGGVRVLEVVVPAGAPEPEHTHQHPSVVIVDRPARLRYFPADQPGVDVASTSDAHAQPSAELLGPEGPHSVENVDDHAYHAFRIEHPQIDWRSPPS